MQKYANIAIKSMNYHINVLNSQYLHFELLARYFGPHHNLAELYKMLGQYDMAKFYLEKLADEMQPNIFRAEQQGNRDTYSYMLGQQASIRLQAKMLIIEQLETEDKLSEALEETKKLEEEMINSTDPFAQFLIQSVSSKRFELESKLGIATMPFDFSNIIFR